MENGQVVSISLDVTSRETGRKVKTTQAQLKYSWENDVLSVLTACEEGMFEARFTQSKLRKAKVKDDLSTEDWEKITHKLFHASLTEEKAAPAGYENVILAGRLTSSEEYDPSTGELVGEELSSNPPEFELSVRTDGLLSVEYASMTLQNKDMEDIPQSERENVNLLSWISDMAKQISFVQAELFKSKHRLEESEAVSAEREQSIQEMKSDYEAIFTDAEDRFFQVLQSKRRKIAELEGENPETLALLNDIYKTRQKSNLKILHLEDIVVGEEHQRYGERRAKKTRRAQTPRAKTAPSASPPARSDEAVKSEHDKEEEEEEDDFIAEDSDMEVDDVSPAETETESKSPEPNSNADRESDSTDYSEPENDAGHVRERSENNASGADNDEDNETEYSD